MQTTEFSSALLRERYLRIDHDSGLGIYIFPKKLTVKHALFAVRYGALDNSFLTPDGQRLTVPAGIAHFLEHKLFENADGGDVMERFAALGADVNAYTTYEHTGYYCNCTEQFEEALTELLQFVTRPHFTPASVQKEQGIITQELREYEDNPWEVGLRRLVESLYHKHPVRENIGGTVSSITRVTDKLLYDCYHAFYRLSNMVLIVCGDVTPEEVLRVADRVLPKALDLPAAKRLLPEEPASVVRPQTDCCMQVAKPIFCIGIKDIHLPTAPEEVVRRGTAMSLLDAILFSRAGSFYNELFESGVITPVFSGDYSSGDAFGFHMISGESDCPELVLEKLRAYLKKTAEEGIPEADFERCRRVLYADELRGYDSTEEIADNLISFVLTDAEMFSYLPVLQSITKEELEGLLSEMLPNELYSMAVIRPQPTTERKDPL